MSARGFGSLVMATSAVGAALGCYLVSLKVASERAKLEGVESEIVSVQRDIRLLQTEIGTRSRLAQLERWNANFIRLSAPSADQILDGSFQLATMVRPPAKPAVEAPVVLAAATPEDKVEVAGREDQTRPQAQPRAASEMMVTASYEQPERTAPPVSKPVKKVVEKDAPERSRTAATDPLSPLPGGTVAAKSAGPAGSPAAIPHQPKETGTPR